MKLLTADQLRAADAFTIANSSISSYDLMEKAATRISEKLSEWFRLENTFVIFCGNGNNGGDGLALARLLDQQGFNTKVFLLQSDKYSPNCKKNVEKVGKQNIYFFQSIEEIPPLDEGDIIIDALLGIGINREINGNLSSVINLLNHLPNFKIAIDIPSGMHPDGKWTSTLNNTFQANVTLTIEQAKVAFLWAENYDFVGDFITIPIDLDENFKQSQFSSQFLITKQMVRDNWIPRTKFSHKGSFGHALTIVGSKGMAGAGVLASKAVLKSGAGLVTSYIPSCNYNIMQTAFPEAMVISDNASDFITQLPKKLEVFKSICVGCGTGTEKETQNVVKLLLQETVCPLVIDADALNILSENKTWLNFLPPATILTPHPGEFDRLAEKHSSSKERIDAQIAFSIKYQVYCVLKGAHTSISTPEGNIFYNSTGNNGMATGGSGDVLAGIITGLLAQGYSSLKASLIGVYLHGLAGDIAAKKHSRQALIASDIIKGLEKAFIQVELEQ